MKLSIIIVTFKRSLWLRQCLESIFKDDSYRLAREVIIVINGQDSETYSFVSRLHKDNSKLKVIVTNKVTPAKARNIALNNISKTDFVLFLDDDIVLPDGYLAKAKKILLKNSEIEVLGGPDRALPGVNGLGKIFDMAIRSPLCTGHTCFRHRSYNKNLVRASESKLILCHMWFKSSLFYNGEISFDERFLRNEENIILLQLKKIKIIPFYSGDLFVYHRRKNRLFDIFRAYYNSGSSRIKMFILYPSFFNPVYILPLLLFLSLIVTGIYSPVLGTTFFFLYFVISILDTIFLFSESNRFTLLLPVFLLKTFILISYSVGQLQALINLPLTISKNIYNNKREVVPLKINS